MERTVFGIHFPHPVGLAPVLERQVELLDECHALGFSFTGLIPGDTPVQTVAERLQQRTTPIVASVELRAEGDELIVMIHFPPFNVKRDNSLFTDLFEQYKVDKVVYGHLHGKDCKADLFVMKNGIEYYLTSCDQVKNKLTVIYEC